jgi:DNA polymerase-3 subunit gamma/tau
VRYAPSSGRYKVYVVDEVHMLSQQAFNGLLKTLEEPPPHVKFVFATTEIRKVPITVLSRCQRFDLRRVAPEVMTGHLQAVAAAERIEVEPEALALIVRCAEGSVRDALSLLDQAIALGGSPVRVAEVQDMLGLADRGRVLDLFDALMAGEPQRALARLDELDRLGVDPVTLVQDLLDLCHGLTRIKLVPEAVSALGLGPGDAERAAGMAARLSMPVLARCWQMLLKGMDDLRVAPLPLQAVEMLLIRLAFAAELPTTDRLSRAGPVVEDSRPAPAATTRIPSGAGATAAVRVARPEPEPEPDAAASSPPITNFATAVDALRAHEPMLASWLHQSVHEVGFEPGRIELRLQANVPADLPSRIGAALGRITGRRWVVVVSNDAGQATLAEQDAGRRAELLARAAEHPTVRSLLEKYPGATLEDVRPAD